MLRYDNIRTDRLKYLSIFASSHPLTRPLARHFGAYLLKCKDLGDNISLRPVQYEPDDFGRLKPSDEMPGRLCLQTMSRPVRFFLATPDYQDIDVVNCAPSVLQSLASRHGVDTPFLDFFVANYERCVADLGDACSDPKAFKYWMLFGDGTVASNRPEWANKIHQEARDMARALRPLYPDVYSMAKERLEKDRAEHHKKRRRDDNGSDDDFDNSNTDVYRRFLSYLYLTTEAKLLAATDESGRTRSFWKDDVSFQFDGLFVKPTRALTNHDLSLLSDDVHQRIGIKVQFAFKPMTPVADIDIDILPDENFVYGSHREAAQILEVAMRGKFVADDTGFYAKDRDVWVRDKESVERLLLNVIGSLNIKRMVEDKRTGEERAVLFGSNTSDARSIRTAFFGLKASPTTCDFARGVVLGGAGKVAFKNGYWQFSDTPINGVYGHFVMGGSFDTFCHVVRNFPPFIQADIDEVHRRVFDPIFSNTDPQLKTVFLAGIARALAGCSDKITWIIHGPRNSGKSVIFQFLDETFGQYSGSVPSNTFIAGEGGVGGDAYRQAGYMVQAETARIIKMAEMPSSRDRHKVKIDGSKLKVFQSMKEGVQARALHVMQRTYYSLGTGFFLMNDVPEFVPMDSMDRCHLVELPNEFVSAAAKREAWADPKKILEDRSVEQFIRDPRYTAAFTHIVLGAYQPEPVEPLPCMIESKNDATVGQGDQHYRAVIEVTTNHSDTIGFQALKEALERGGIQDNSTAMGRAVARVIRSEFRIRGLEEPSDSDFRSQDQTRRSETFGQRIYHYLRLRNPNSGGSYSAGFVP